MIQVEEGLALVLEFTAFDVQHASACTGDYLTITDGDGTTLMGKSCGTNNQSRPINGNLEIGGQSIDSCLPAKVFSRTNVVKIFFKSTGYSWNGAAYGWSVSWSTLAEGESPLSIL